MSFPCPKVKYTMLMLYIFLTLSYPSPRLIYSVTSFDVPKSILWKYAYSLLFCTSISIRFPFEFSANRSTRLYLSYSSSWLLSLSSRFLIVIFSFSRVVSSPSSTLKFALSLSSRFIAQSNLI